MHRKWEEKRVRPQQFTTHLHLQVSHWCPQVTCHQTVEAGNTHSDIKTTWNMEIPRRNTSSTRAALILAHLSCRVIALQLFYVTIYVMYQMQPIFFKHRLHFRCHFKTKEHKCTDILVCKSCSIVSLKWCDRKLDSCVFSWLLFTDWRNAMLWCRTFFFIEVGG